MKQPVISTKGRNLVLFAVCFSAVKNRFLPLVEMTAWEKII